MGRASPINKALKFPQLKGNFAGNVFPSRTFLFYLAGIQGKSGFNEDTTALQPLLQWHCFGGIEILPAGTFILRRSREDFCFSIRVTKLFYREECVNGVVNCSVT
ncbi:hypothetical protein CDAR_416931 [Caerostris darwini]|uniref:Uncharacterized protein n=1 Tax=Caerostris darwini TaxID=1538125 RepID=A0AAV4X770_9ARAC|nr:hypothetical protein CDAR_416931 [Caerostris darwini]